MHGWKRGKGRGKMKSRLKAFPWERVILSMGGVAALLWVWWLALQHLYALPQYALPTFQAITTNMYYAVAAVIIFAVTGHLVYDWKNQTGAQVEAVATTAVEDLKETFQIDPKFQTQELQDRYGAM